MYSLSHKFISNNRLGFLGVDRTPRLLYPKFDGAPLALDIADDKRAKSEDA